MTLNAFLRNGLGLFERRDATVKVSVIAAA
jgi:hypothetical protein